MPTPQAPLSDIWKLKILADIRPGGNMERVTFSRTGVASYFKHDLTVGSAATGILRTEWLKDPVSGIYQPYLKLEAGATNSCLQSQALATAPWTTNLLTATNNNAAAPDGTITGTVLVPTAVSSNNHLDASGNITITANENLAISCFVKVSGYSGLRWRVVEQNSGSGTDWFGLFVDVSAGTIASFTGGTGVLAGSTAIALGNGWYWIGAWGTVGNGRTTVSMGLQVYDTYAHAVAATAFTGDAVSGVLGWGAQLERNGANALPPTSYIPTTTIAVARGTDAFTVPYFVGPTAGMWAYLRFIERGGAYTTVGVARLFGTDAAASAVRFMFYNAAQNRWQFAYSDGTAFSSGGMTQDAPVNSVIELLGMVGANGAASLRWSINGAADQSAGPGGAVTFPSQFDQKALGVGNGSTGTNPSTELISRVLVGLGAGTSVTQIQDVRGIP